MTHVWRWWWDGFGYWWAGEREREGDFATCAFSILLGFQVLWMLLPVNVHVYTHTHTHTHTHRVAQERQSSLLLSSSWLLLFWEQESNVFSCFFKGSWKYVFLIPPFSFFFYNSELKLSGCFFLSFICLFIFGCTRSSLPWERFPQLRWAGATLELPCLGFSLWWLLWLQSTALGVRAPVVAACAQKLRLLLSRAQVQ